MSYIYGQKIQVLWKTTTIPVIEGTIQFTNKIYGGVDEFSGSRLSSPT